jgi:hypothetical protein
LTNEEIYPALACDNYKNFNRGLCDFNSINFMGIFANSQMSGKFYLKMDKNDTFNDNFYRKTMIDFTSSLLFHNDIMRFLKRIF